MSERPYKVEQWSNGFADVTNVIPDASDPKEAHAEFDRVVKRRPRGWYAALRRLSALGGGCDARAGRKFPLPSSSIFL
jgi:hypothetical protein